MSCLIGDLPIAIDFHTCVFEKVTSEKDCHCVITVFSLHYLELSGFVRNTKGHMVYVPVGQGCFRAAASHIIYTISNLIQIMQYSHIIKQSWRAAKYSHMMTEVNDGGRT